MPVHPVAAGGFAATETTAAYERGRPQAPPEAVEFLALTLKLGPGRVVADLGAGTGKFARLLTPSGARVLAVEPVAAMRDACRAASPGVTIAGGTTEALPLRDESVDAMTAAQAFHWFDGPAALAEISRVLRPGGGLALVWSERDRGTDWSREISELVDAYRGAEPTAWSGAWLSAFERPALLGPLEYAAFPYPFATTAEGIVDRVMSISVIALLPEAERREVAERVRRIVRQGLGIGGDEPATFPYTTHVFWCVRRG